MCFFTILLTTAPRADTCAGTSMESSPLSTSPLFRYRMMALAAPVFWSVTGVTVRFMESATEWQINFWRSLTLSLFMLAVLAVRYRRALLRAIRATGVYGPLGGLFVGAALLSNIYAISNTTVANATLLMATSPVFGAVLGWLILRERVRVRTWVAVAIAVAGSAIMVGAGIGGGGMVGDLIALLGVFFFGCYSVVLRRGGDVDMSPAVLFGGVFSTVVAGIMAWSSGAGLAAPAADIMLCVLLGIFQLGVGSLLFAWAARAVPAVELTLYALGEAILSPLWSWLGVGEVPAPSALVGGGVILAAIVVQTTGSSTPPAPPPSPPRAAPA